MKDILSIISKAFSFLVSVFLLLWKALKYTFSKFWKFILLIITGILALFGIKKAVDKEN